MTSRYSLSKAQPSSARRFIGLRTRALRAFTLVSAAGLVALPAAAQFMPPPPMPHPMPMMHPMGPPPAMGRADFGASMQRHFAAADANRDGMLSAEERRGMARGAHAEARADDREAYRAGRHDERREDRHDARDALATGAAFGLAYDAFDAADTDDDGYVSDAESTAMCSSTTKTTSTASGATTTTTETHRRRYCNNDYN